MDSSIQSLANLSSLSGKTASLDLEGLGNPLASGATSEVVKTIGPLFTDVMSNMASGVIGELQNAERVSLDAVQGKANTREVVDSLMTAEQSLKTAIAIRDKIVTAYLDVTRMQI